MSRRSGVAVALAVALAAPACLGSDAPVTDGPDAPVTATADPLPPGDADVPGTRAELVEPTPGMLDVRPVSWDEATVDGTTVTLSWWSGVAPCNVLDRVEVDEGEHEVVLTIVEGTADRDAACIEIAQRKSTAVELAEPVGQRRLVDGAAEAA